MGGNTYSRVAVICRTCGNGYAAELGPDGEVRPLGGRQTCHCGSSEFEVLSG